MSSMEKMNSAQIAFLPIGVEDWIPLVEDAVGIIRTSGLHSKTNSMTTEVRGTVDELCGLLHEIHRKMDGKCQYIMDFRISNTCGCVEETKDIRTK